MNNQKNLSTVDSVKSVNLYRGDWSSEIHFLSHYISFEPNRIKEWFELMFAVISNESSVVTLLDSLHLLKKIPFRTLSKYKDAVSGYQEEKSNQSGMNEISLKSAVDFLYLIPIVDRYSPSVYIDADTGFVGLAINTPNQHLFSALMTDTSSIHFSFVGQREQIYKISGTLKVKTHTDLQEFKKILQMVDGY